MSKFILVLLAAAVVQAAQPIPASAPFSLSPQDLLAATKADAATTPSDATILLSDEHWTFAENGAFHHSFHLVYQVLTTGGVNGWSQVAERWEPWHEHKPEVRVRVVTPDGTQHDLDPATINDTTAGTNEPDSYSDVRVLRCPFPAVSVGSVVEEEIDTEGTALLGSTLARSYFARNVPTRSMRLTLDYPEALPLRYKAFLLPDLKQSRDVHKGMVHLTFELGPQDPYPAIEPMLPSDMPHWPNILIATAAGWPELVGRYNAIVEKQLANADISSMLSGIKGDRMTVIASAVHELHKQVRYTGIEFADAAIVPARPAEVLKRKYGDCKDKATLLVAMLRASGIPAYVALLNAGFDEDVDPNFPGMGLFNHAIVYVPGKPDLWIDATAQFSDVGSMPDADQGREALIIREGTTTLTRIPESVPGASTSLERRIFYLPEYGKARVREISSGTGNVDAGLRAEFAYTETDAVQKNLRGYMRNAYLSGEGFKAEHSVGDDFSHPFELRLEVTEAARGNVSEVDAAVGVPTGSVFNRLPNWFRREPPKKDDTNKDAEKPRKNDLELPEAFVSEVDYEIHLPPGFQPKHLPTAFTRDLGPAKFSEEVQINSDVVTAKIRFDSVKRRYTAEEAQALRAEVYKIITQNMDVFLFEPAGQAFLNQGRVREAIASFRGMVEKYPKSAVYHVQISRALIAAACGKQAREEARLATATAPDSRLAWQTLGLALTYDEIGRQFKKGWDPEGSEAAFRKAIALDAKDTSIKRNLAVSLEYDADGYRYHDQARMKRALDVYLAMSDDDLDREQITANVLYVLVYLKRYDDLRKRLDALQNSDEYLGLRVTATAGLQGTAAAIAEADRLAKNRDSRNSALATAGEILANLSQYAEAADLIAACAEGSDKAAETLARANLMRNMKHFDVANLRIDSPENLVRCLIACDSARKPALISKQAYTDDRQLKNILDEFRMPAGGVSPDFVRDVALSMLKMSVDRNGASGYRVRTDLQVIRIPGSLYLIEEDGALKLLGNGNFTSGVGRVALRTAARGDLQTASKWLNWMRSDVKISGDDDAIGGPVFPRLWSKGRKATAGEIRLAAAVLIDSRDPAEVLPILKVAMDISTDRTGKAIAQLAYIRACLSARAPSRAKLAADSLLREYPDSASARLAAIEVNHELHRSEESEHFLREAMKADPDDTEVPEWLTSVLLDEGKPREAEAVAKANTENPKSSLENWNTYGWIALVAGDVTQDKIDGLQQILNQNPNAAPVLHTVASMFADIGKTSEARDMIQRTMDAWQLDEPNSECWYVFGRLAEQYGVRDAALTYYGRVEKPEEISPESTYALAQKRLQVLAKSDVVPDSTTGGS